MEVEVKIGKFALLLVVGRQNQDAWVSLFKLTYENGKVEFADCLCEL